MGLPRVYISMGTPYSPEYLQFRDELEAFLRDQCGVDPRIIGKNEYPTGSPLPKIREVMRRCHGVIVVAYERKFLESGIERRGSASPTKFVNVACTITWNHIESAIAFSFELPLYIICQNGILEEGLLEAKIDWYVHYTDIGPGALLKSNVSESLRSWIRDRVSPRSKGIRLLTAISGQLRLSDTTPKEFAAVLTVLLSVFAFGATAATVFQGSARAVLEKLLHKLGP